MFKTGLYASPLDTKDYIYGEIKGKNTNLPSKFFWEKQPIKDQGGLGSCVGFASSGVKDKQEMIDHPSENIITSPIYIYSECKKVDGIPNDEGTFPRVALEVLRKQGVCLEKTMPYSDNKVLPNASQKAHEEAQKYKIKSYARIYTVDEIKQAIFEDSPVLTALIVTDSFMKTENGFINNPIGYIHGGHAVYLDGYDDNMTYTFKDGRIKKGFFRLVNSWGEEWGNKGYGWLPYDFINFKSDLGMPFFMEAWTSLDETTQQPAKHIQLWVNQLNANIDGKTVTLDQAPVIDKDSWRTLVPLRFICEAFRMRVKWIAEDMRIDIGDNIKLWINKKEALVNGKVVALEQAPYIDSKTWRTLIPVRFVSEVMGYKVEWDEKTQKIDIMK